MTASKPASLSSGLVARKGSVAISGEGQRPVPEESETPRRLPRVVAEGEKPRPVATAVRETPLVVLASSIQDSVKICAELPPEEYFELINHVWRAMGAKLRKYYATYGKHVGDGMVYYFFPQPDCNYILNAIHCAHELKETMRSVSREWQGRKNWTNELKLNIGLDEGEEWFGSYHTPTHLEFTALGDTINRSSRLSDFARDGSVWATKNLLGKLTAAERSQVRFGIRRRAEDGEMLVVPSSYSRISNLVDLDQVPNHKFQDIAVLPVTEILDVALPDDETDGGKSMRIRMGQPCRR